MLWNLLPLQYVDMQKQVAIETQDSIDIMFREWARSFPELDTRHASVTGRIRRINFFLNRNAEEVFRRFNTTGASFDILAALFAAGPPCQLTPTQLYRGHMMSSAGITARLDVVERAGLAARSRDPRDRRGVLVTLTKTGQKVVRDAAHALHRRQAFLSKVYTEPERKQVLSLLKRMLTPLEHTWSATTLPAYQAAVAPWVREFPNTNRWLVEFLVIVPLLTGRLNRDAEQFLRDYNLTVSSWWILIALRRSGDAQRLSPGELSRTVSLSSAGMTAQLDQLEDAGLVERSPHPEDRRAIYATLTRSGQKLVDRAVGPYFAMLERFVAPLSARDRQTLSGLLRNLLLSLEASNNRASA